MAFTDDDLRYLKAVNWSEHEKHQPRDCGELASLLGNELPRLISRLETTCNVQQELVDFIKDLRPFLGYDPEATLHKQADALIAKAEGIARVS